MGGDLVVLNGSCRTCNGEFGVWEATIKDNTRFLLNLLQIENRDGVVPTAKVNVGIRGLNVDGLFGIRDAGGEINLSNIVINKEAQDGKKHREGFFVTKEAAERFVERCRKRGDQIKDLDLPPEIVIDATHTLTLPFAFSLETRKVVAKIALAALAHQYGTQYAVSDQFDELRNVRTASNAQDLPLRIFANKGFIESHVRTAYQHSVMCYLSAGMKKGWAIITLFGGLSYVVNIASQFNERESRQFSIFYDARAREPLNPVVLANEMTLSGHVLSPGTKFEDKDAVDAQWFPIIAAYCAEAGIEVERIGAARPKAE